MTDHADAPSTSTSAPTTPPSAMPLPVVTRTTDAGSFASVHGGDALSLLAMLPDASFDAVVTDPPYAIRKLTVAALGGPCSRRPDCDTADCHECAPCGICVRMDLAQRYSDTPMLGQQSQNWHASETHSRGYADNDPNQFETWCRLWLDECLRLLKPGGHLVAFGGTRTWHRLAVATEDAGFEIRDSLAWLYSSGMPKSYSASRALTASATTAAEKKDAEAWRGWGTTLKPAFEPIVLARRPLDGTLAENIRKWGVGALNVNPDMTDGSGLQSQKWPTNVHCDDDQAAALRAAKGQEPSDFFWVAKPGRKERVVVDGVAHPTVKPLDLLRRLIRLTTPPRGLVLDPFAGSGTTLEAALLEGVSVVGIEREPTYLPLVTARIDRATQAIARPVDPTPTPMPTRETEPRHTEATLF